MAKTKDKRVVNIHEAKTNLSRILKDVEEKGVKVLISRNGKVIAELSPTAQTTAPLKQHPQLKKVVFLADPLAGATPDDWPEECI